MRLISILTTRQLVKRKLRTSLTVLSIALGVALHTSIDLVNDSTLKSFDSGIEALSGRATLTVSGGPSGFSEDLLPSIERVEGVGSAVPLVETQVYYTPPGKTETETLVVLGVDLLRESSVRAYHPTHEEIIEDPLSFLNQPDSIILTRKFAESHGLRVGDSLPLSTSKGKRHFVIRGLLNPEGPAVAYGGHLGIMDIDAVRLQFGKAGKLDRVDILPGQGVSTRALRDSLEATLEEPLIVETPSTQSENMKKLVEGYQGLLSFVGVLALIVGLFLVFNAMTIAVAERKRELGILRALGADRKKLTRHLLEEGLLLGLLGSTLGLIVGRFVATQMVGLISKALSNQYLIPVHVDRLNFTIETGLMALILGTATALLGTGMAALRGLKIEPLEAVRDQIPPPAAPGWVSPLIGVSLLAFIVLDSKTGLSRSSPTLRTLNPFCLIFGAALSSPLLVRLLIRAVAQSLPLAFIRLSSDNLLRNSRRTSSNLMTLMSGLILVMILSLLNGSIKFSVLSWFRKTLSADLVVSSTGRLLSFKVQPLSESLIHELNRVPGLDVQDGIGATGLRYVQQRYEGKTLAIKAYDPPHPRLRSSLIDIKGTGNPDDIEKMFFASDEPVMLVSENFVMHFGKKPGEMITLSTPSGAISFRIIGVVAEFTNPEGVFYLSRRTYKRIYRDDLVSGFFLMAKPGVSPIQLKMNVDQALGESYGLMGTLNSELSQDAEKIVDESFTYTKAIEWSALLVGLFGLFNTLYVSILERKKEFGVLRAIGISRISLLMMVLSESLMQGILGGIVAIGIALFAGYFWIIGTLSSLMGWVLQFSIPTEAVGKTLLAGALVGTFAGIPTALKAGFTPIRESLDS